jgi:peptidoglycan hydrolase CwlO-like protein
MIHRREATQRAQLDETEDMTLEVRVAKIESHVEHIQSDVTDIKLDVRELQHDVKTLNAKVDNVSSELKGDIAALALSIEKFRGSMRTTLTAIIIIQVLTVGGAAGARVLGLL